MAYYNFLFQNEAMISTNQLAPAEAQYFHPSLENSFQRNRMAAKCVLIDFNPILLRQLELKKKIKAIFY